MPHCHYCKAKTDIMLYGITICEQCAIEREAARRRFQSKYVDPLISKPEKPVERNGAPKWFVDDRDVREE